MANNVNISLLLRTRGFTKGLANAKKQLTTFGQVSTTVGRTMQYALGGALIAVGADAAKAAADFDLATRKLKALAGPEAAAGVEGLAATARQLGKNSIFTAAEVANLQVEMKKLGLTTKDVKELSAVTVKFATAMDTDAANAGAVLVKTLNKFKSSFEDYDTRAEAATKLSDQMAHAVLNSALTFDTLQSSLGYAGGEAEAAGFSFSDTTAILAELANAGFEGSRAGTILRRIFINLAKTGTADLNSEFFKLITNQQEFADLIKITGARSAGGIASIQGLRDVIEQFAASNEKASGEVEGLYDAVDQSLTGRVKNLRSAFQELGIVIEQQFGRQLKDIISSMAEFLRGISAADIKMAGTVASFLLMGKVAKGLKVIVGNLALAFAGGGGVAGLAKTLLRFNPAGVLITAFAAGMAIMNSSMNDFKNRAAKATESINDMFAAFAKINEQDDPFTNKVSNKSFSDKDAFLKAADDRQQNLALALEKGRNDLNDQMLGKISKKDQELVEEALRSGLSVTKVIGLYREAQSDGFFSGWNNEEDLKRYKKYVFDLNSVLLFEKDLVDLRNLMISAGTSADTTYWDATTPDDDAIKKVKDLIKIFETAQGKIFGGNTGAGSETTNLQEYTEALRILGDVERQLAADKAQIEARGGTASEGLEQQIKENKTLQEFYKTNAAIILEMMEYEQQRVEFMEKKVGLEAQAYSWAEKQKKKAQELAAIRKKEREDYGKMGETLQGVVDRLREMGFTMRESLTAAMEVANELFNALMSGIDGFAQTFATALVDPAKKMSDSMKEWGRQMLQTLIAAITKVGILTAAIAIGNKLTGGGVTALLKVLAASGTVLGGGVNLANKLAGGDSLGNAKSTTGYIAGSDLVLTTTRGVNARDRIYG